MPVPILLINFKFLNVCGNIEPFRSKNIIFVARIIFFSMSRLSKINCIDIIIALGLITPPLVILLSHNAVCVFICLAVAYLLPRRIYRNSSFYTPLGLVALCMAFVSMALFLILNYWQSVVQLGSPDAPHLLNDPLSFYSLSRDLAKGTFGQDSPIVPYMGYPLFLSLWVRAGIADIACPIVFNLFLVLCSMILVARTVMFVLPSDAGSAKRTASYAMLLMALIPGILNNGTMLVKEAFIIAALSAAVCALYALKCRHKTLKYALLFTVAILVLALCRTTYLYILLFFVAAAWLPDLKKRDALPLALIFLGVSVSIAFGSYLSHWGDGRFVEIYVEEGNSEKFICGDSQVPYENIIGPYHTYPLWLRFLLLPICVAVQFMIPFPFVSVAPQAGLPLSMAYLRMSYLWYLAAIPMFAYYLFYWWRKGGLKLSLFALAAAISYCVPAFVTGGTVSRYAFCFVPFLAVMGGFALNRIRLQKPDRKHFLVFSLIYIVLIVAALYIGAHPYLIMVYIV